MNDAAQQFYFSGEKALLNFNCVQSTLEPAIFFYHQENELCDVLACHVDNFLDAGNAQRIL